MAWLLLLPFAMGASVILYLIFWLFDVISTPVRRTFRTVRQMLCGPTANMMAVELLTELPMGLLSIWLLHTTKFALNILNQMRFKRIIREMEDLQVRGKLPKPPSKNALPPNQWSPMYPMEAVKSRMFVTIHELVGPRWNAVGTLGYFAVCARHSGKLQVSLVDLKKSAKHFTVVVYAGSKTVANVGTMQLSEHQWQQEWLDVTFPAKVRMPTLGIRLYGCHEESRFPAVRIPDNDVTIIGESVPCGEALDSQEVFDVLRTKEIYFYRALHWHMYPMLCFVRALPLALVRRTFLPAGNAETGYAWGAVHKSCRLRFECTDELWGLIDMLYVVIYTRGSITMASFEIPHGRRLFLSAPVVEDGFFLVRMILGSEGFAAQRRRLAAGQKAPSNDPTMYSFQAAPQQLKITCVNAEDVLPPEHVSPRETFTAAHAPRLSLGPVQA
jgi:hypothetical protein